VTGSRLLAERQHVVELVQRLSLQDLVYTALLSCMTVDAMACHAQVMTVRVAVTQKLRERIPSIAAVQLVN
jgi:hypothetical protein